MDKLIEKYIKTKKDYQDACEELMKEMDLKGLKRVELPDMILTLATTNRYISIYKRKLGKKETKDLPQ